MTEVAKRCRRKKGQRDGRKVGSCKNVVGRKDRGMEGQEWKEGRKLQKGVGGKKEGRKKGQRDGRKKGMEEGRKEAAERCRRKEE